MTTGVSQPAAGPRLAGVPQPPWTTVERLLVVACGSASAAFLPYWLNLLRVTHPDLRLRVVVTASAERFVTPVALVAAGAGDVERDVWPPPGDSRAPHVELSEWAHGIIVHPASFHFLARLALGLGDSPAILALQCTRAPVVVAPAPPPGATAGEAYQAHVTALAARRNVEVAEPQPARSITTGRQDAWTPAPLPHVLGMLEACRTALHGHAPDAHDDPAGRHEGATAR